MDETTRERREAAMRELTEQRDNYRKKEGISKGRRGLLIVNTGKGKGKTTAALGLMMRAHGRGLSRSRLRGRRPHGRRPEVPL